MPEEARLAQDAIVGISAEFAWRRVGRASKDSAEEHQGAALEHGVCSEAAICLFPGTGQGKAGPIGTGPALALRI